MVEQRRLRALLRPRDSFILDWRVCLRPVVVLQAQPFLRNTCPYSIIYGKAVFFMPTQAIFPVSRCCATESTHEGPSKVNFLMRCYAFANCLWSELMAALLIRPGLPAEQAITYRVLVIRQKKQFSGKRISPSYR